MKPPIAKSYLLKRHDIKLKHVMCNGRASPEEEHDHDKDGIDIKLNGDPIIYDDFKKYYCSFERHSILHSKDFHDQIKFARIDNGITEEGSNSEVESCETIETEFSGSDANSSEIEREREMNAIKKNSSFNVAN